MASHTCRIIHVRMYCTALLAMRQRVDMTSEATAAKDAANATTTFSLRPQHTDDNNMQLDFAAVAMRVENVHEIKWDAARSKRLQLAHEPRGGYVYSQVQIHPSIHCKSYDGKLPEANPMLMQYEGAVASCCSFPGNIWWLARECCQILCGLDPKLNGIVYAIHCSATAISWLLGRTHTACSRNCAYCNLNLRKCKQSQVMHDGVDMQWCKPTLIAEIVHQHPRKFQYAKQLANPIHDDALTNRALKASPNFSQPLLDPKPVCRFVYHHDTYGGQIECIIGCNQAFTWGTVVAVSHKISITMCCMRYDDPAKYPDMHCNITHARRVARKSPSRSGSTKTYLPLPPLSSARRNCVSGGICSVLDRHSGVIHHSFLRAHTSMRSTCSCKHAGHETVVGAHSGGAMS
eukprot:349801-Chlamydomonas_euryale.AAC.14